MDENPTPEPLDPATAWANPPGMGKALTIGVGVGVAVSFFGVLGAFLAGGQGWGPSIGMGIFVALWGGLGFGGMIGGVVWASRAEESAKRDRLAARESDSAADVLPARSPAEPGELVDDPARHPDMERVAS